MPKGKKAREISVRLGNKPGTGAILFARLKDAGINVVASCCYQIGDDAHFAIVTEDHEGAQRVLDEAGLQPSSHAVVLLEMDNEVGAFASILQQISKAGVDINSAYVTTTSTRTALAVIKTSDDDKVLALLDG